MSNRTLACLRTAAFVALALGAIAPIASATSYTWNNAAGGAWSSAANWTPSGVPASGDAAALPTLAGAYTVTLDQNATIDGLTLGSGATLDMASGDSLTYSGSAIANDGTIVLGAGNVLHVSTPGESLAVNGSGTIQMSGGRIGIERSRPSLHFWMLNGAGHTIAGTGDIWMPLMNRGSIVNNGGLLTLWQYLFNYSSVRVTGGRINVHIPLVKQFGGTITGTNGWFTCDMNPERSDMYNYGPIDSDNGGSFIAEDGDLHILAGVFFGGTIQRSGSTGAVLFHDVGNPQDVVVESGAELVLEGLTLFNNTPNLLNHGTVRVRGTLVLGAADRGNTVETASDGTIVLEGATLKAGPGMTGAGQTIRNLGTITGCGTIEGDFDNQGTVEIDCPSAYFNLQSPKFTNRRRIVVDRGYLRAAGTTTRVYNFGVIDGGNGGITVESGATISNTSGTIRAGRSNVQLGQRATAATISGGTLASVNGGYFVNYGRTTLREVTLDASASLYTAPRATTLATGAYFQNAGVNEVQTGGAFVADAATNYLGDGTTRLRGGTLTVPKGYLVTGALRGAGTVVGAVTNAGVVGPDAAGTGLVIQGEYRQNGRGVLEVGIGGYAPEQYSRLVVSGGAAFDGRIAVAGVDGFTPAPGRVFDVVTAASREGTFASIDGSFLANPVYDLDGMALETASTLSVGGAPAALRFAARGQALALELPAAANVLVRAYDVNGRQVAELVNGARPAGVQTFALAGRGLASGVYFARATVSAGGVTQVRDARVILLH